MHVNLAEKRTWARVRKHQADEIRRQRRLSSEGFQESGEPVFHAVVVGVTMGLVLLVLFFASIQGVSNGTIIF